MVLPVARLYQMLKKICLGRDLAEALGEAELALRTRQGPGTEIWKSAQKTFKAPMDKRRYFSMRMCLFVVRRVFSIFEHGLHPARNDQFEIAAIHSPELMGMGGNAPKARIEATRDHILGPILAGGLPIYSLHPNNTSLRKHARIWACSGHRKQNDLGITTSLRKHATGTERG